MLNVTKERVAAVVAQCITMKTTPVLDAQILPKPPHYLQLWQRFASSWTSSCPPYQAHSSLNQVCILQCLVCFKTNPLIIFAVKYFVISSNFLQKMFSVKVCRLQPFTPLTTPSFFFVCSLHSRFLLNFFSQLIQVDWPLSIMSLFDWVRFFSFSINVVRPECAFSWKFETKVIITLLTPISISLLVLMSGFVYGCIACFRTLKNFERSRIESGKYVKISYLSLLHCWWVSSFCV